MRYGLISTPNWCYAWTQLLPETRTDIHTTLMPCIHPTVNWDMDWYPIHMDAMYWPNCYLRHGLISTPHWCHVWIQLLNEIWTDIHTTLVPCIDPTALFLHGLIFTQNCCPLYPNCYLRHGLISTPHWCRVLTQLSNLCTQFFDLYSELWGLLFI